MGDSAAWYRFTGIQVDELPDTKYRTGNLYDTEDRGDEEVGSGDILKINGVELVVISSPMGEEPYYLFPKNNASFTFFAHSRWDGHGGGAYDYDAHADPFTPSQQELANLDDYEQLDRVLSVVGGEIKVHEGWFDSIAGYQKANQFTVHEGRVELSWEIVSQEAQVQTVQEKWNDLWAPMEQGVEKGKPFALPRRAIPRLDPNEPWVCNYCSQPAVGGYGQYDRCCAKHKQEIAKWREEPWVDAPTK